MELFTLIVIPAAALIGILWASRLLTASVVGWADRRAGGESTATYAEAHRGPSDPLPEARTLIEREYAARQPTYRISVVVQLLFAHLRIDGIYLDAVVLETPGLAHGTVAVGAPLSLKLERPRDALGAASEAMLQLWAEHTEVVEIGLSVTGEQVRAEFSKGSSRLTLDIHEAAGLS